MQSYAEATWTQQLPDWIGSHVRAFAFLGGASEVIVPDNLRSGVSKAHLGNIFHFTLHIGVVG
jgi:transposase